MFQVVKRDGQMDEFKIGKITSAIDKAFNAQEKNYSKEMIDLLGLRVTADFQNKIKDNKISVEEIQDSVENVLIQAMQMWQRHISFTASRGKKCAI